VLTKGDESKLAKSTRIKKKQPSKKKSPPFNENGLIDSVVETPKGSKTSSNSTRTAANSASVRFCRAFDYITKLDRRSSRELFPYYADAILE
jgi:hypothetical protein